MKKLLKSVICGIHKQYTDKSTIAGWKKKKCKRQNHLNSNGY